MNSHICNETIKYFRMNKLEYSLFDLFDRVDIHRFDLKKINVREFDIFEESRLKREQKRIPVEYMRNKFGRYVDEYDLKLITEAAREKGEEVDIEVNKIGAKGAQVSESKTFLEYILAFIRR